MIQELHQKRLPPIPPPTIQPGEYYAVDYMTNYYFGRVIDKNDSFVQFKFLHTVSATTYHWPRQDDMDRVHLSNIFASPITVPHFISGPFEIPEQPAVGVANGKCETLRDRETSIFLCEPETF